MRSPVITVSLLFFESKPIFLYYSSVLIFVTPHSESKYLFTAYRNEIDEININEIILNYKIIRGIFIIIISIILVVFTTRNRDYYYLVTIVSFTYILPFVIISSIISMDTYIEFKENLKEKYSYHTINIYNTII